MLNKTQKAMCKDCPISRYYYSIPTSDQKLILQHHSLKKIT